MDPKKYLISILAFALVMTGFWYMILDVGGEYGVTISDDYNDTYSELSAIQEDTRDLTTDIRDDVRDTEAEEDDQYGGSLIKGAFNSLRMIWNSFTSVNTILETLQEKLGIPEFWILGFMSMIILGISFAIIYAVLRWSPG